MTECEYDYAGKYTVRQLLKAENDIFGTLDFLSDVKGSYVEEDRVAMIENNMFNVKINEDAKALLEAAAK